MVNRALPTPMHLRPVRTIMWLLQGSLLLFLPHTSMSGDVGGARWSEVLADVTQQLVFCLPVCLPVCLNVCMCVYVSVCLSACVPAYLSLCLSACRMSACM